METVYVQFHGEQVETARVDSIVDRFNTAVIVDMTDETMTSLDRAISQYNIIKKRLRCIELRLERAMMMKRYASAAGLEIQRDTALGVLCMYTKYVNRKIMKINGLQEYRAMHCRH